jgi:hypothetical protein
MSSIPIRPLWRISNEQPHLPLTDLMPLTKDVNFFLLRLGYGCSGTSTLSRQSLVPRSSINTQDASNIVPITRDGEFTVSVPPLVQEVTDSFSDLVFAILAMMASPSNGIDRSCFPLVFKKNLFKVFDGLLGVKAMEIDIELGVRGAVLVALFVKLTSCFSMSFSHRIILALATKT